MEANTTELFMMSSDMQEFAQMTAADRAAEIFNKPLEVTSFVLCIVGLIANCFSITATAHIPRGQSTHSKLIISLGVSDSLILAAILLHNFMYIFSSWDDCTKVTKRLLLDMALLATLINLLVMAIDHYFAIVKPLYYQRSMSNFRGNCLIIFIWVVSICTGLVEMIVGLAIQTRTHEPICSAISEDEFDLELVIIAVIFVVLLVIVVIYTRIYILVKRLMVRDRMMYQDETHGYKAIITTMLIIGTFTLFWAPEGIFQVYMYIKIENDMMYVVQHFHKFTRANDILFLILQLNSLADPIIYAIRLRDVQRGYRVLFYKLFPTHRYSINEEEFRQRHLSFTSCRRDTNPTIMNDNVGSPDGYHENRNLLGNDAEKSCESSFISNKNRDSGKKQHEKTSCDDSNITADNMDLNKINATYDQCTDVTSDKINKKAVNNNVTLNMDNDSVFVFPQELTAGETN